ncbi:hypothetical protein [Salinibacter phage M8CC-19]|uniref:Uncharacterized protein n=2 Tax=Kryptosalinivirus M8CC19 TaxID=2560720 RepID=A0A2I6UG99_9CAUD|nr:hypothetical protein FGG63_gp45 [Salinibacter phage M8CC-19]AUO79014.1 hypothetical protein [Salinibacter phage M8CC-19]AUO79247.1 hypothetical protein [Salinibacter phage M31CC-1]
MQNDTIKMDNISTEQDAILSYRAANNFITAHPNHPVGKEHSIIYATTGMRFEVYRTKTMIRVKAFNPYE